MNKFVDHQYDIIHYAGHVILDKKTNEYALRLNGGELLSLSSIKNLIQFYGTPIVFINAGKAVEGLTDAFLKAGVQLVIGSLYEAPDAETRVFSEKFYDFIINGIPVEEAKRLARMHVLYKTGNAATGACFVMYGDPLFNIYYYIFRMD